MSTNQNTIITKEIDENNIVEYICKKGDYIAIVTYILLDAQAMQIYLPESWVYYSESRMDWPTYKGKYKVLHNENGPAIYNSKKLCSQWIFFGKFHRTDGPAIECDDKDRNGWYLNGKQYVNKEAWYMALTSEQKKKAIWNFE